MSSLVASSIATAQSNLPNGGFETWVPRYMAEAPQSWLTGDDIRLLPTSTSWGNVTKSANKRTGSFAARLESIRRSINSPVGPVSAVFPGELILGTRLGPDYLGGIPYLNRPAAMEFYYQLSGTAQGLVADSAGVQVLLTKQVAGITTTIAEGTFTVTTATTGYTLGTVPLTYRSAAAPDSLRIVFTTLTALNATVGTTLIIDDVSLKGGTVMTAETAAGGAFAVYPNPSATGLFQLDLASGVTAQALTVVDGMGRVVLSQLGGHSTRQLDLRALPAGMYLLRLSSANGLFARRLIIQ